MPRRKSRQLALPHWERELAFAHSRVEATRNPRDPRSSPQPALPGAPRRTHDSATNSIPEWPSPRSRSSTGAPPAQSPAAWWSSAASNPATVKSRDRGAQVAS